VSTEESEVVYALPVYKLVDLRWCGMSDPEYYIRRYGLDKNEVLEWGMKNYPEFAKNLALIAQLYLIKVKGITPKPPLKKDSIKKVADLQENERAVIRVAVTIPVAERSYKGCPICRRKVNPNNMCPNCGIVEPVELKWLVYNAGDDSGEILLSFPPGVSEDLGDISGAVIVAMGTYRDGEFLVDNYDIETQPVAAEVKPAEPTREEPKKELEETQRQVAEEKLEQPDKAEIKEKLEERSPMKGIEVDMEKLQLQQDIEKAKILVKYFRGQTITAEEYEAWKQRMGIKTPDDVLFEKLGIEKQEDGSIFIRGVPDV